MTQPVLRILLPVLLCISGVSVIRAQQAEASAHAAEVSEALPRAEASDEKAVRALLGKRAVITGKVTGTFESDKGITFINLERGKFTVVTGKENYSKFKGGSPALLYRNKHIEVTGEVFEYKGGEKGKDAKAQGKLEIRIFAPDQVKIIERAEADEGKQEAGETAKTDKPAKDSTPDKDAKKPARADKSREGNGEGEKEKPEEASAKGTPEAAAGEAGKPKAPVDPKKFFK